MIGAGAGDWLYYLYMGRVILGVWDVAGRGSTFSNIGGRGACHM